MKLETSPYPKVSVNTDTTAIRANNLSKCYQLYIHPHDRLKQFLWRGRRQYFREFWALYDVSFELAKGEVLGIIGRNGSGKSTLLQLVCDTLTPTAGEVSVYGRVAALLELGAGFNPEFTGRENVFMNATIMGLNSKEIGARFEKIVDFSGIRDFIDQPVKTYSSGMSVRLAFSVAINVDPDILVIDEALSVGDGVFSRKSFERIMALKESGKTILFCSHALYQIEAICDQVLWLDKGHILAQGSPAEVIPRYNDFLGSLENDQTQIAFSELADATPTVSGSDSIPRITNILTSADGISGNSLKLQSEKSDLVVEVFFTEPNTSSSPSSIGVLISGLGGAPLLSAISCNDGIVFSPGIDQQIHAKLCFPKLALLKGIYTIDVFLMCDQGIFVYEHVRSVAELMVSQTGREIGVVTLPHVWRTSDLNQ